MTDKAKDLFDKPHGILSTDGKVEYQRLDPPMIFKKILDIQEEIPVILKDREFIQNNKMIYKFRGIDDLYNALNPLFKKHRVFMTPEILQQESTEKPTNSGSILFYEKMTVRYKLWAEDGSSVEASTRGIGMDSGDKAANKAMSVAQKYALIQIFSIPTEDKKDPEDDSHDVASHDLDIAEINLKLNNCKTQEDVRDLWTLLDEPDQVKELFTNRFQALKK